MDMQLGVHNYKALTFHAHVACHMIIKHLGYFYVKKQMQEPLPPIYCSQLLQREGTLWILKQENKEVIMSSLEYWKHLGVMEAATYSPISLFVDLKWPILSPWECLQLWLWHAEHCSQ